MMFNNVSLQVVPGGRQGVHGQGVEDHPKAEPEVELEEKKEISMDIRIRLNSLENVVQD